ncbi:MAG: hypothetical protein WA040_21360 [Anaerolineae bacterium]
MADITFTVADLPIVEFGCEQISYAQLVQLIGEDAAGDLLQRSHRALGWIVDRYMLCGRWLWVDVSWEGGVQPTVRHYYGE